MATGNMLQGMARGAVGDVVFYRQNGQQMSRIRVRNPRNPRTYPQVYQRAIMATVVRAYQAGKAVFDHSFQGRQVGAQNMAKFIQVNAKILRRLCAEEIDILPWVHWGGATIYPRCRARLVAYSTNGPVAFEDMQISRGSYQQTFFSVTDAWAIDGGDYEPLKFGIPGSLANETCAEFAKRCHLIADDLYTICGFYPLDVWFRDGYDDGVSRCGLQREYFFFIIRMHVKSDFVSSSAAVAGSSMDDIFTFEQPVGQGVVNDALKQKSLGEVFTMEDLFSQFVLSDDTEAWCNIIRSRVNEDLRSTTVLKANCAWADSGIIPAYVLPAWIPYITGNPYPNPPIPPEPAAPTITAVPLELTPGVFSDVLGLQLNDGTKKPFLFNGSSVIRTGMLIDNVPTVSLMMMECQSVAANYTIAPDGTDGIPAALRVGACALDSSWVHTVIRIDAGLYSMYSDELELPNMEFVNVKITNFHV